MQENILHKRSANHQLYFVVFLILLALLFIADIIWGSVSIPITEVLNILFNNNDSINHAIVFNIRLPKAITAVIVGAGLSVCGLQMQTLFRNPLAGPFVLGISSGASLGVAIVTLATAGSILAGTITGKLAFVIAASIGAAITLLLVLSLSRNISNDVTVLIIGLMISSIVGAFEGILQYMSSANSLQVFIIWGLGSFSNTIWNDLSILFPIVGIGLLVAALLSKQLNSLLMGENYAQSIGVNIKQARLYIILCTAMIAGSITAFCGPIAFLGVAVPHLTKGFFKTSDHKILVPAVCLTGATLALLCDMLTQLPIANSVLPINAITSLIGAPVVIWVVWKQNRHK